MRYGKRCAFVIGVCLSVLVVGGPPAGAHIEITPESAPRGSLSVLGVVVPNESDTASTVRLELEFPTAQPILAVLVQPIPGWQTTVEKQAVTQNGQSVDAISRVTWTGGSFGPGQFQQFYIRAALPKTGKRLTFKALQTYSDGQVVRWIEPAVKGAPEPEKPAPVLVLTSGESH